MRVTSGELREVCAATVSAVLMYFNGVETEERCTKLDAEPLRGRSTDSSLGRTAVQDRGPHKGHGMNKVVEMLHKRNDNGRQSRLEARRGGMLVLCALEPRGSGRERSKLC